MLKNGNYYLIKINHNLQQFLDKKNAYKYQRKKKELSINLILNRIQYHNLFNKNESIMNKSFKYI